MYRSSTPRQRKNNDLESHFLGLFDCPIRSCAIGGKVQKTGHGSEFGDHATGLGFVEETFYEGYFCAEGEGLFHSVDSFVDAEGLN
jgi:hypothetical protein